MGTVPLFQFLVPGYLSLHQIPFFRLDNCRMAILHKVLGYRALVGLHFLLQEIHCKGFLQDSIAPVCLIRTGNEEISGSRVQNNGCGVQDPMDRKENAG